MKKRYPHPYVWKKIKDSGTYIKGASTYDLNLEEEDIHSNKPFKPDTNPNKYFKPFFKDFEKITRGQTQLQKTVTKQIIAEIYQSKIKDRETFIQRREQIAKKYKTSTPSNDTIKELLKNTKYEKLINKIRKK